MKKIFTLIAVAAMAISANAQKTDGNVTWVLGDSNSGVASDASFATTKDVTVGTGLSIAGTLAWKDINFTKFQPTASDKGNNKYSSCVELEKYIDFQFKSNFDFTASKVSFDIIKIGTGDPKIYVAVIDGTGTQTLIAGEEDKESSAIDIRRNNEDDPDFSINQSFTTTATAAAGKDFTLRIYVGKCANTKQVGLANVVIQGSFDTTTRINSIKTTTEQNSELYNATGQKVDKSYKGIVIQNGRKFVNK